MIRAAVAAAVLGLVAATGPGLVEGRDDPAKGVLKSRVALRNRVSEDYQFALGCRGQIG